MKKLKHSYYKIQQINKQIRIKIQPVTKKLICKKLKENKLSLYISKLTD